MDFTHAQISELLLEVANSENGTNLLMQMTLETFMKSERVLHPLENPTDYANGFRTRTTNGFGKEMVLKVPRTRSGTFYPALLGVLRNEDEEHRKLIFSLYRKGLTTEQVSDVYEELYGKDYSKQQISYLMKESKKEIELWLKRDLEEHYLVLYIDATFVHTRRDNSVKKEGYFTISGIKEEGTREVLTIVNHPTEGALLWQQELESLKTRGVKSIGLVVSDGLTSIENASAKVFPNAKHQLCVVHFKRNILAVFPRTKRVEIAIELKKIYQVETKSTTPIASFEKLINFVQKRKSKYPSIKSFKNERNIAYFTYLDYPPQIQRMVYSTNWIERLNRDYKRVLKMRGAMPNVSSVIALMGSVALEKEYKTYKYPVSAFRDIEELKRKKETR
ncbi:IS256 family transposase [Flavobacterium columnare]|uniref:IS256 family transposase n=1 Tax=Flavobacterium columnare TaxID=996 RepID=UPI002D20F80D|nr:IS256 family transposase [Flavobacterium columnare]MEB3800114.1 IS256 family transposase [Flavobacterium columnare]